MAKVINEDYTFACGNCKNKLYLPGIVPDMKMLKEQRWKYCPICGEELQYNTKSCCSGCKYNVASISNGQVVHHCVTDEGITHYDPNFGKFGAEAPDWCPIKCPR